MSHVMRGRPSCLLQSAGGEANRILLASALSSMRIICPNRVSRRDWIMAVSLGCFISLCTSSFRTNWYHGKRILSLFFVSLGRILSKTAKQIWLKFCTRMEVCHRHCVSCFGGNRPRGPASQNVPWVRYCISLARLTSLFQ